MKNKMMRKLIISLIVTLVLVCTPTVLKVKAMSYNYDFFQNVVPSAEGLSYDITYYSHTIKPADGVSTDTVPMDGLNDMEVYQDKIYLLNFSTVETSSFVLHPEQVGENGETIPEITVSMKEMGKIAVLNDQFQWETIVDEFPFCQDVLYEDEEGNPVTIEDRLVDTLNRYYSFTTPLSGITTAQVTTEDLLIRAPYVPYSKDFNRYAIRLRSPEGITVTKDGIYVADTASSQIVHLNFDFEVVNIYLSPEDPVFYQVSDGISLTDKAETGLQFRPTKVAVDVSGRVYCIAKDIYQGIIEFSKAKVDTRAGQFNRFLGKNEVVANPLKAFWAKIFSEAQLGQIARDFPPMFTNITIDSDGFLYATSLPDNDAETGTTQANMVKAINTAGKDVMKRNGYVKPNGDVGYIIATNEVGVALGPSSLEAVAVDNKMGVFTTVDSKRGRLFTYDMEGNLLYITGEQPGGTGTQGSGGSMSFSISDPVAIDYFSREYIGKDDKEVKEDLLLVLDKYSKSILVYKTTEFGRCVNLATSFYQEGKMEEAEAYWRDVIKINTNYELAYLGIGKSLMRKAATIEEYKEAMSYFESAHSATYYSKAYSFYRDAVLRKNFNWIMTTVAVVVIGIVSYKCYKYVLKKKSSPYNEGGDE